MQKTRTTLEFNSRLLKNAKKKALDEGCSLTRLIERALGQYLAGKEEAPTGFKLELLKMPSGFHKGVDVSDREALYKLMGGRY